jgi:hypothetical protein
MQKVLIIILLGLLTSAAFAQSPTEIENRLLTRLANLEKWSNYGGNSDFDRLEKENSLLRNDLMRYGRQSVTLSYPFKRLKGKMFVSTSKDGRLRIYSWDEETGGTMHDFDSVFQFKGKGGKVYTWTAPVSNEYDIGGFYHDIFQVNTTSGPIYLPVSTFIGSTSSAGQTINCFKVNGEKLDYNARLFRTGSGLKSSVSFGYDFFSVVDRPERPVKLFNFDQAKMEFRFPVVIEDEKTPQGRVTDKFITYRFNGKYFAKVG